ncbi:MAG TPA: 50S ribosomal protein L25 [Candidatus Cloacimonas sp.]|nr:50S ribosomal protein L25 [Candidatus Cloacimonas sp.]
MIFNLKATPRETVKKSDLHTLRAEGLIPAVLYGPQMESIAVSISKNEFTQMYKKSFAEVSFWDIELNGKQYHTILKDKQVHPVSRDMLHLDFMTVSAEAIIEVEVPIIFTGEAIGVKEGGMMEIVQRHIKIACKADEIPEDLTLDVSNLKMGDSLHIRDLRQGNWQVKEHGDVTLVTIHSPKAEVKTETTAAPTAEEQTTSESEK